MEVINRAKIILAERDMVGEDIVRQTAGQLGTGTVRRFLATRRFGPQSATVQLKTVLVICDILGCTLDELLPPAGDTNDQQ